MKKKYIKPQVYVEDFTMCQQIASGCTKTEGAKQYEGACTFDIVDDPWGDGGELQIMFNSSIPACTTQVDQIDCQDGPNNYGGYFFS